MKPRKLKLVENGLPTTLTDAEVAHYYKLLQSVQDKLEGIALAVRIGMPCSPTWRYRSLSEAKTAIADLAVVLATIAEEFPE